ncbi:BaiN/RdsA family NAD(P)/FAD-dependent oxidoreductase [Flavisolibacter nicotianae]|uniref:NAD(P)/FAD-dependent oxidoreductase n=1 Tax=Flavisolibacter nicotianae TaxID=2364882 RepID=UPI000EAC9DF3|nr:NAD(P)/FAD-dependent oxidoreductase [Flavisolibacter nicotianae]
MRKQLVVIGGGAGGLFCAVNAARMNPGLQVTIVEKTSKLLSKVRVSGGGRCNVTHALFDIAEMSKRYPRGQNFVKKTFHQFFTTDTINWFEQRGVKMKAEKDGRMFPVTDSSQTIIDCLLQEANLYGVDIRMNADVRELTVGSRQFSVKFQSGEQIQADFVCLATGGYPKASMFDWLQNLGHSFAAPVPSLFTFNLPKHPITALMGVSVETARVKIEGSKLVEEGPVLITHWGLSGPAVLRLSAWGARELEQKQYTFKLHLNWLPDANEQSLKESFSEIRKLHAAKKISNHNFGLPNRLWHFLLEQSGVKEDLRFADLPAKTENALIRNLVDFVVDVKGKTTFKEEFVTAGGINVSEVDPNTLMSRKVPNLFFAGEVLDVDGITGGFNFQHAWTSGWIAAKSISALAEG